MKIKRILAAVVAFGPLVACSSDAGDVTAQADVTVEAETGQADSNQPAPTARSVVTTAASDDDGATTAAPTTVSTIALPDYVVGVDEAVRFETGGTSAVLSNGVIRGERNRYTLDAAAGQTMILAIASVEDNAVFEVYGPNGAGLIFEATSAAVPLAVNGTYTIFVGGTRGNASYELTVEIPAS